MAQVMATAEKELLLELLVRGTLEDVDDEQCKKVVDAAWRERRPSEAVLTRSCRVLATKVRTLRQRLEESGVVFAPETSLVWSDHEVEAIAELASESNAAMDQQEEGEEAPGPVQWSELLTQLLKTKHPDEEHPERPDNAVAWMVRAMCVKKMLLSSESVPEEEEPPSNEAKPATESDTPKSAWGRGRHWSNEEEELLRELVLKNDPIFKMAVTEWGCEFALRLKERWPESEFPPRSYRAICTKRHSVLEASKAIEVPQNPRQPEVELVNMPGPPAMDVASLQALVHRVCRIEEQIEALSNSPTKTTMSESGSDAADAISSPLRTSTGTQKLIIFTDIMDHEMQHLELSSQETADDVSADAQHKPSIGLVRMERDNAVAQSGLLASQLHSTLEELRSEQTRCEKLERDLTEARSHTDELRSQVFEGLRFKDKYEEAQTQLKSQQARLKEVVASHEAQLNEVTRKRRALEHQILVLEAQVVHWKGTADIHADSTRMIMELEDSCRGVISNLESIRLEVMNTIINPKRQLPATRLSDIVTSVHTIVTNINSIISSGERATSPKQQVVNPASRWSSQELEGLQEMKRDRVFESVQAQVLRVWLKTKYPGMSFPQRTRREVAHELKNLDKSTRKVVESTAPGSPDLDISSPSVKKRKRLRQG
ncbi:hypothetical protein Poli38472_008483 [Pythium oligandrum]|uniref:Uncharacterized protein n=1 Tax=Pythium oligandrum TaxID=41045 RepID=A0A8K1C3N7_PYTOL|nr:hypothetical protein Poli38472_008483 [Pythium oligandrum]|eukprot:TMW55835.1 hypothetical protein Poli38472_008483 [Pythium oligandrum]